MQTPKLLAPALLAASAALAAAHAAPAAAPVRPQQGARWTPLPLPELCRPREIAPAASVLADAAHVQLDGPVAEGARRGPPLPVALLVQMLEDELRREGLGAEVYRAAPPLLARGDAATLERLGARLADLDRAARELEIDLVVGFAPVASTTQGTPDASGALEEHRARVASGATVMFGERRNRSFLAGFDVEVAADSGASTPLMGTLVTGRTLHLVASRVAGGVHVEGVLDIAELDGIDLFDPGSIDLGRVQEPRVASVQIAFSDVVREGERILVSVAGAPLAEPDWTVWIEARATTPARAADDGQGFETLDLAFVARAARRLAPPGPGAGLEVWFGEEREAQGFEPLAPSSVAAAVEAQRSRSDTRGPRVPLYWTNELLFVPRADAVALAEARELVRAAEAVRLATRRVELEHGAFKASFPVTLGRPARVVVGTERTLLVDYDIEIAPESWMPAPLVEAVFDGLVVDLAPFAGGLAADAWIATSDAPEVLDARAAMLGRVQLPARGFRSGSLVLRGADARGALFAAAGDGLQLATSTEAR